MKSRTIDGITIKESNCLNRGIKIDDIIYVFFKKPTTANYGTNRNNKLDDTNKEQLRVLLEVEAKSRKDTYFSLLEKQAYRLKYYFLF